MSFAIDQPTGTPDLGGTARGGLSGLAELAARALAAPIGMVFLGEGAAFRLVARFGAEPESSQPVIDFCRKILEGAELAATNLEFGGDARFCAAAPIFAGARTPVGVLCVVGTQARFDLDPAQRRLLALCAAQASTLPPSSHEQEPTEAHELTLRALFDAMAEGVVLQDQSGAVVTSNAAAARILGVSRETIERQNAKGPAIAPLIRRDRTPMPDEERPAARVLRSGGTVTDCVMGMQIAGSETKWISANAVAIQSPRAACPTGVVVTFRDITEHVRMAEKVAESEASFRALFNSLPVGICVSHGRTMRYVNQALVLMLGYDADVELVGHETSMVVHPNSVSALEDRYARIETGVYPQPGLIECRRRDGQSIVVEVSSMPGIFEGKLATIAIIRDVTERDRATRALARSEARLRALVAFAPVGIFETDATGRCLYVNDRWSAITGLDGEAALNSGWLDAVHPDDRESMSDMWRGDSGATTRPPQRLRFLSPGGREILVWLHTARLLDEAGSVAGYLGAIVDFTDQYATEKALLESEANFRTLSQRASVGIGVREGAIVRYANPALVRIFGFTSEDDMVGRDARTLVAPESRAALVDRVEKLQRERAVPPQIMRFTRPDRVAVDIEVDSVNIEFGGRRATMSLIRDVTELRRAHEERDHAHRALVKSLAQKVTLLKEVHHRVKNNLQVIASLLRLGREYVVEPKSLGVFNDSIARVHSIALIHERLYQSEDLERVDLVAYLRGLVAELRRANASPVFIDTRVVAEPIFLDLDRCVPVGLIVNELVTNAFKHAFNGPGSGTPCVTVSYSDKGERYELCVEDNGIGLKKQPNSQESLGLLLVGNLVKQLQGAQSVVTERGTHWLISFPKQAEESEQPVSA